MGCKLGTQKGPKHKHFIGISLPYWVSLEGDLDGISLSIFLLMCFFGALVKLTVSPLRRDPTDGKSVFGREPKT